MAPLEDCYRPDLSPPDPGPEHAELATALAEEGVDLLLVETFPHVGEAIAAVQAAAATGLPVWCSLTAGFRADLLTPEALAEGARRCIEVGATAVLVNCVPATATLPYVQALSGLGVPFGAYANAGHTDEGIGWVDTSDGPARYAAQAGAWHAVGARLIGACCGAGPEHVAAVHRALVALG
jgi:S-methylmethionine-dependent homocysteine/selenocysteine methylase